MIIQLIHDYQYEYGVNLLCGAEIKDIFIRLVFQVSLLIVASVCMVFLMAGNSPTTGECMIQGKEISGFGSREKAALRNKFLGFVTQDFALIPHYTVERNVRLPLDYTHMSGKEKKSRVEKILRELHIGDKKKAYPSQLSGGQKQRVAIARALVNDAKVLLCDEPTGALDSATSSEIMGIFEELNRSGKTVIVVTHHAKVAESCKRLICIEDGRIKSDSLR